MIQILKTIFSIIAKIFLGIFIFIGALFGAIFGISYSSKDKHHGKCDGDCANCPPHYGYRYGRWYYGHDHMEGCTFGGNRGGGGRD